MTSAPEPPAAPSAEASPTRVAAPRPPSRFQRIIRHLRKQHWGAVFLELFAVVFAVVFGVFLGFQLNNWNEARAAREDYARALERLSAEIDINLAEVSTVRAEVEQRLPAVVRAIEILQACEDTPESREQVNAALSIARATHGIRLRRAALNEITTSPHLLARQSEAERRRFADMAVYFDAAALQSDSAENLPLAQRIEDLDAVTLGPARRFNETVEGRAYTKVMFPIVLKSSVKDACKSGPLMMTLFNWYRWQSSLPPFSAQVSGELEKTKAMLRAR